jgi:hypothetical protein
MLSTNETSGVVVRIVAYPGEIYRLAGGRTLRAVSGRAWITHSGRDIILTSGERAALAGGDDLALVSGLGRSPLVLEVLSDSPDRDPSAGLTAAAPAIVGI